MSHEKAGGCVYVVTGEASSLSIKSKKLIALVPLLSALLDFIFRMNWNIIWEPGLHAQHHKCSFGHIFTQTHSKSLWCKVFPAGWKLFLTAKELGGAPF